MPSFAWSGQATPRSTLFPYTTLFRSRRHADADDVGDCRRRRLEQPRGGGRGGDRSEEHTSELQSLRHLVCRLLLGAGRRHRDLHFFPTRRSSDLVDTPMPMMSGIAAAGALSSRAAAAAAAIDRKSTRLNSSHLGISYAVFCLERAGDTEIYTFSLHDALPISSTRRCR